MRQTERSGCLRLSVMFLRALRVGKIVIRSSGGVDQTLGVGELRMNRPLESWIGPTAIRERPQPVRHRASSSEGSRLRRPGAMSIRAMSPVEVGDRLGGDRHVCVLPDHHWKPARPGELDEHVGVPALDRLQLQPPSVGARLRRVEVLRATGPEAAVHRHLELRSPKDHID